MSSARVRVGIIGLGLITQTRHLPNLERLSDIFEVVRVCDLSPKVSRQLASDLGGIAWGTDAAEVLAAPDVDAVLICTPGAHSTLARRALESGKHVFAEKPYAYEPGTAARDAAYADERGLVLQVGYMKMYEPAMAAAREMFDQIGPVRLARVTVLHPSDENQTSALSVLRGDDVPAAVLHAAIAENRSEVASALEGRGALDPVLVRNVLFGSVCHDVAVLRELFPGEELHALAAVADTPSTQRTEPPRLQLTGALSGGTQWSISWNWVADYPGYSEWVELIGDRGAVRIDLPAPYGGSPSATLRATLRGEGGNPQESAWTPDGPDAFERELAEFAASIRSGAPVRSSAAGAAADSDLLLAVASLLAEAEGR
jgi:myo-inositol 2-dehydrogenase/D-chiro-inositol 1-dehydrogenase